MSGKGSDLQTNEPAVITRMESPAKEPSSATGPKPEDAASSSDLSDLDEDVIVGDIEPDHYYEGGQIPVFRPTMDQFRSFSKFIEKIDKYGMKSGIVKVIPPAEWIASLGDLDDAVKTIKIKNPIKQEFNGNQGLYRQLNMEQPRSYNLPEWRQLSEAPHHQPPARRGERRRNQERITRGAPRPPINTAPTATRKRKRPGRPKKAKQESTPPMAEPNVNADTVTASTVVDAPPTPTSPKVDVSEDVNLPLGDRDQPTPGMPEAHDHDDDSSPTKPKGRQPKSVSSRRKYNRRAAADTVDHTAFESFDYRISNKDEYTPERCDELERSYWKGLTYSSPLYGADMPGSLFKDSTTSWNVAKLDNLLNVLGQKVPGVNTAYLYLGMWKSTFAWHLEDVDLYSINYIHFGAPKQWYSISQADARKFEGAMRNEFPEDAKKCDQFLRHKSFLISPSHLQNNFNIKVNRLVHHEGEFVITFPYGYHSGYNIGYNCAESVNFATPSWLEYGRVARKCECESDSVWIDVGEIERKLRGEDTEPEESDVDSDDERELAALDLPTPPESIEGKPKRRGRKRKDRGETESGPAVKRIRMRVKDPRKETCILCPNDPAHEPLCPTDNGKQAHAICALYIPETYIAEDGPVEKVCNVTSIDKARMGLKCHFCRSVRGACFQCSFKKCTRAYHATCAAPGGVLVDRHDIPIYLDDGKEYKDVGVDYRCRFHRPKRSKAADGCTLEGNKFLMKYGQKLTTGDVIQMQYLRGDIFAGVVINNRPDEHMVLVDVLPSGGRLEMEYKWILALDPADSSMPYASATALPIPADQIEKSQRQQSDLPQPDESFGDKDSGYTWAEFQLNNLVRNPNQARTDISRTNKLWYYLGESSTEYKAEYTEDPSSRRNNRLSHFLDSVKPAPALSIPRTLAPTHIRQFVDMRGGTLLPTPAHVRASNSPYASQSKDGYKASHGALPPQYRATPPVRASCAGSNHIMDPAKHGYYPHHQSSNHRSMSSGQAAVPSATNERFFSYDRRSANFAAPVPENVQNMRRQDSTGSSSSHKARPFENSPSFDHRSQKTSFTNANEVPKSYLQQVPKYPHHIPRPLAPSANPTAFRLPHLSHSQEFPATNGRSSTSILPSTNANHSLRLMTSAQPELPQPHVAKQGAIQLQPSSVGTQNYFAGQSRPMANYQSPFDIRNTFTASDMSFSPPTHRQPQKGVYSTYEQFWAECKRNSTKMSPPSSSAEHFPRRLDETTDPTQLSRVAVEPHSTPSANE